MFCTLISVLRLPLKLHKTLFIFCSNSYYFFPFLHLLPPIFCISTTHLTLPFTFRLGAGGGEGDGRGGEGRAIVCLIRHSPNHNTLRLFLQSESFSSHSLASFLNLCILRFHPSPYPCILFILHLLPLPIPSLPFSSNLHGHPLPNLAFPYRLGAGRGKENRRGGEGRAAVCIHPPFS